MAKASAPVEPLGEPADSADELDSEEFQALRAMIDRGMAVPQEELCAVLEDEEIRQLENDIDESDAQIARGEVVPAKVVMSNLTRILHR
jgi:hypothetical protein